VFGLFKSEPFADPHLGSLTRAGGKWKGSITFGPHESVELRLSGGSKAPDTDSLELARQLPERFNDLVRQIESGLFEHYQPYEESASRGDPAGDAGPVGRVSTRLSR